MAPASPLSPPKSSTHPSSCRKRSSSGFLGASTEFQTTHRGREDDMRTTYTERRNWKRETATPLDFREWPCNANQSTLTALPPSTSIRLCTYPCRRWRCRCSRPRSPPPPPPLPPPVLPVRRPVGRRPPSPSPCAPPPPHPTPQQPQQLITLNRLHTDTQQHLITLKRAALKDLFPIV